MSLTIRDIATLCHVGVGTVSRVVNGSPHVSARAREAVLNCIAEHRWTPAASAQSLSTGKSDLIGIVLSNVGDYFHYRLLDTLRQRLRETRCGLLLSMAPTAKELRRMLAAKVRCVIIISPDDTLDGPARELIAAGIPVLGLIGARHFYCFAHSDHRSAVYHGVSRLIAAGHKRIGFHGLFATGDPGEYSRFSCCYAAFDGYRRAMEEHGLPFDTAHDFFARESSAELRHALRARTHSAWFVYPWSAMMNFYILCREEHLSIPDDLSVIGLECDDAAAALNPPPDHFVHNYEKFADLALEFIEKGTLSELNLVEYKFMHGQSIREVL